MVRDDRSGSQKAKEKRPKGPSLDGPAFEISLGGFLCRKQTNQAQSGSSRNRPNHERNTSAENDRSSQGVLTFFDRPMVGDSQDALQN